jgi:predicted metallo-beta-lactamase superfamily hydrolase
MSARSFTLKLLRDSLEELRQEQRKRTELWIKSVKRSQDKYESAMSESFEEERRIIKKMNDIENPGGDES